MSIRSSKGQEMIGEIVIYGAAIFTALAFFLIITLGEARVEEDIRPRVDYSLNEVKAGSAIKTSLNGDIYIDEQPSSKYGQIAPKELLSLYLSTNGNIRLGEDTFSESEVQSDLEQHFNYTLDASLDSSYYRMKVENRASVIEVSDGQANRQISYSRMIPLAGGETAEFELWVQDSVGDES
ncbi:hypothetical protein [Candidatus Nanohalococcus occultus]|uniref:hypothetical protein n=1 Tax=Candidatus Nanohalococcus occultus TaxID=2978047 RepID=UPI0039E0E294